MDFSGQALSRRMLEPLADVLGYIHDLRELSFANCGLEDDVSEGGGGGGDGWTFF